MVALDAVASLCPVVEVGAGVVDHSSCKGTAEAASTEHIHSSGVYSWDPRLVSSIRSSCIGFEVDYRSFHRLWVRWGKRYWDSWSLGYFFNLILYFGPHLVVPMDSSLLCALGQGLFLEMFRELHGGDSQILRILHAKC